VLVIIIAVTGLGNFAIPNFSVAFGVRIIRFVFIIAAGLLGFYGISLALVALLALLYDYKSFGIPFVAPSAPKTRRGFDLVLRGPIWKQELRPDVVNAADVRRQPAVSRKWTVNESEDDYDEGGPDSES